MMHLSCGMGLYHIVSEKYMIEFIDADSKALQEVITKGQSSAKTILHANFLFDSDRYNKAHDACRNCRDLSYNSCYY